MEVLLHCKPSRLNYQLWFQGIDKRGHVCYKLERLSGMAHNCVGRFPYLVPK